ncbi:hypothetical protein lerEdw1_007557, partial [Lerista edwardsae]
MGLPGAGRSRTGLWGLQSSSQCFFFCLQLPVAFEETAVSFSEAECATPDPEQRQLYVQPKEEEEEEEEDSGEAPLLDQVGMTVPEEGRCAVEDAEQVGPGAASLWKAEEMLSPCCAQGGAFEGQDLPSPYPREEAEGDYQAFVVTT